MTTDKLAQTPFNMAILFYIQLNKLIEAKNNAYLAGDLDAWFRHLNVIYRTIIFKVNDTEKKKIEELLTEARKLKGAALPKDLQRQFAGIYQRRLTTCLDKFDQEMTLIMDKRNMIFPNIDIKDGLTRIYEQYGLNK